MHVFLTGEVQVGKSTVIDKVLAALNRSVGGFRSGYGPDRAAADRWLYLWDAAGTPIYRESHGVARFTDRRPEVFPERFDALGCEALRRAQQSGADLILMDECGRLEHQAAAFQQEILDTLEGDVPVLGVVRQGSGDWLDAIRRHPKVTLLTVTEGNRDALPGQIVNLLQKIN